MDTEAGGSGDRTSVWGEISSQPCVEDTERYGVKCTEKPERRAHNRDEVAIRRWREGTWPEVKKPS